MDGPQEQKDADAYYADAREAGLKLQRVFHRVLPRVKPGESYAEIIHAAEEVIRDSGVEPAFPPQLSVNDIAAHDTARVHEDRILPDEGVFKLDLGVHRHGVIADAARSKAYGWQARQLLKAVRAAYAAGEDALRRGEPVGQIGERVQEVLEAHGVKPVQNLSGHGLQRYQIHTDPQIPNIATASKLTPARHTAFEPFGSLGSGIVQEHGTAEVFRAPARFPTRDLIIRRSLHFFQQRQGLPFSRRELAGAVGVQRAAYILQRLRQEGVLVQYPPLRDTAGGLVAQWENTLIHTSQGWKVLTGGNDEYE